MTGEGQRIVFLTMASYPVTEAERNLYSDLFDEIVERGNDVIVFRPEFSRWHGTPSIVERRDVTVISVPTGRVQKVSWFIKAVNTILLEYRYTRAVKKYISETLDLVVYSTPPITVLSAIRWLKNRTGCRTYLLLKDIFPQNAVDLEMIKRGSLIWRFFRSKERKLYAISDAIGCMSNANVTYLLRENPEIPVEKVHVCPNAIKPIPLDQIAACRNEVPKQFAVIPNDRLKLIYAGNLGKPQGIDFLIDVIEAIKTRGDVHLTIVGSGTEYQRLQKAIDQSRPPNVVLSSHLPKSEYLSLLSHMDIGLVFLDRRFTIPNFPSRVLDYLDFSLPVIACTDTSSDLGVVLEEANAGWWCRSGDVTSFVACVEAYAGDASRRKSMGRNARDLLERSFSVRDATTIMLRTAIPVQEATG